MRATTSPSSPELCNSIDDDCDGEIDEEVLTTFTEDADGDGYGAQAGRTRESCRRPAGYAPTDDDCDDTDASVNPSAVDACDAAVRDEDCSGAANDPPDGCTCTGVESRSCGLPGRCEVGTQSCASGQWSACSIAPVPESCNTQDDDCDGAVDEGQTITCFLDADSDGYALFDADAVQRCPDASRMDEPWNGCPALYTGRAPMGPGDADCDDSESTLTLPVRCWTDADRDGYGSGDPGWVCPPRCTGMLATRDGDCCDTDDRARPGQVQYYTEPRRSCGGYDYDCSGSEERRHGTSSCRQVGPMMCSGSPGYPTNGAVACGVLFVICYSDCAWFTNMFGSGCTSGGLRTDVRQECR